MQIVLRILVALLGLGGAAGAGFTGYVVQDAQAKEEQKVCRQLGVSSLDEAVKLKELFLQAGALTPKQVQEHNDAIEIILRNSWGIWFLYAAGGLGLFGTFLGLFQQSKCAAAVLLAAAIGPAVIMPPATLPGLAVMTGALPVAGLLAFFIGPTQRRPRASSEE
jgi:hypothetical protein